MASKMSILVSTKSWGQCGALDRSDERRRHSIYTSIEDVTKIGDTVARFKDREFVVNITKT